jgi:deoxycytidylate deaminase
MQGTRLHAEHDALLKLGRLGRKKTKRMVAIIVRFRVEPETNKIHLLPSDPCVQCNKLLYYSGIRKIIVPNEMTNTLITKKITDPDKTPCPVNFVVQRLMKEKPTFLNPMYRKNKREQKRQIKNMGFRVSL